MKQGNKNRNSPRRKNAITRAINYLDNKCGFFGYYNYHSELGYLIWLFGFKADKYDVLNSLCSGTRQSIITFARGDIRHTKKRVESLETILALIVLFIIVTIFVTIGY